MLRLVPSRKGPEMPTDPKTPMDEGFKDAVVKAFEKYRKDGKPVHLSNDNDKEYVPFATLKKLWAEMGLV
jgi:hypothetical protein